MAQIESVLPQPSTGPSGADDLAVRRRWLKQRRGATSVANRTMITVWVCAGTLVAWLFIAGVAGFGH